MVKGKCKNVNYEDIPRIWLRRDIPYNFIIVLKRDDISVKNKMKMMRKDMKNLELSIDMVHDLAATPLIE